MTTYRDAQDEIETLRADLATWETAMAEVEALKADLAQARTERDYHCKRADDWGDRAKQVMPAAQHAVDVYRQGNLMGTIVAVDRLGEALDGAT